MNLHEINTEMNKLLTKYNIHNEMQSKKNSLRQTNTENGRFDEPMSSSNTDDNSSLCHICNIYVPRNHTEEHVTGTTHIVLLKLAHHASERINRHISQQIDQLSFTNTDKTEPLVSLGTNSDSYCVQCNLVIRKDTEESHMKEKGHQTATNRMQFVTKLFNFYTELHSENVVAEINEWSLDSGIIKETCGSTVSRQIENYIDGTLHFLDNLHNNDVLDPNSDYSKSFLEKSKLFLKTKSKESGNISEIYSVDAGGRQIALSVTELVNVNAISSKEYTTRLDDAVADRVKLEIIDLCSKQLLKDYGVQTIKVSTVDGGTLSVSMRHYHAIYNASGDTFSCLVCGLTLEDSSRFTQHIQSQSHTEMIAEPVWDMNGCRKITIDGTAWHNCVLCNSIHLELDPTKHIETEAHIEAAKIAAPAEQANNADTVIPYDISLTTVDVEMLDQEEFTKKREVTKNKSNKLAKSAIQKNNKGICGRPSRPSYRNGFVFCNICGVKLYNKMSVILQHVKGRRHQTMASQATPDKIECNNPDIYASLYYRKQDG